MISTSCGPAMPSTCSLRSRCRRTDEIVLGVLREGVVHGEAAARAEREILEVLFLRKVGRQRDGVAAREICRRLPIARRLIFCAARR